MKKFLKIAVISAVISGVISVLVKATVLTDYQVYCIQAPCPGPQFGGILADSFIGYAVAEKFLFYLVFSIILIICYLVTYKPWKNLN